MQGRQGETKGETREKKMYKENEGKMKKKETKKENIKKRENF